MDKELKDSLVDSLPIENSVKHVHICLLENPNKASTQLWNLAFFSFS